MKADVTNARFSAISSELQAEDVSAMPKQRLLAMLDKDARKYGLESPSADLGYMTAFTLLREKVKKHPWDDCAKFLAERAELFQGIESAKRAAEAKYPSFGKYSGARTLKNRAYYPPRSEGMTDGGFPGGRFERFEDGGFSDGRFERFDLNDRPRFGQLVPSPAQNPFLGNEVFLSFGPTNTVPGQTMCFQAMPQFNFRCTRLLIPSYAAPSFVIHDLRVGRDSVFGANSIPAAAFTENAVGFALALDVVVGLIFALRIENTTNVSAQFTAALCGVRNR